MQVVFSEEQIRTRVREMALEISRDYGEQEVHAVGILENGFMFLADLVRQITCPVVCHFMKLEAVDTMKTGQLLRNIVYGPIGDIRGKNVLLVDALVESGITLDHLTQQLLLKGPQSVRTAALLNREERRRLPLCLNYSGFTWEGGHVIGYGLEWNGLYRNLPYLATIAPAPDGQKKQGQRANREAP